MGRKVLEHDGETVIDGDYADVTELQDDIDGQLNAILTEVGTDVDDVVFRIGVYRIVANEGDLEYCFSATPAELPILDKIRDDFGPGKYEIRVFRNNRIFKRPKVRIAPIVKKVTPIIPTQDNTAITDGLNKLGEMIMLLANRQEPVALQPQQNPMEMMTGMMTAMAQMQQMTAMMQPKQDNQMGLVLKGMELAKEFNSDGGEKSSSDVFMKLIDKFGGPIVDMSLQAAQAENAQKTEQINNVQPNQPKQGNNMNVKQMMLKMHLATLVKSASLGKDPGLYADLILDQMNDDDIRGFITSENALQKLGQLHAGVTQHIEWFEKLRDELLAALNADEDLTSDPNTVIVSSSNNEDGPKKDAVIIPAQGNDSIDT